ncbi:hypothetical protein [Nocardia mexicana]|uniref:Uncharacterized protein n=1 Tax=Nocardia mexicana TaxID=279262 RepID=A0A370H076_9NOCA|nr:hypothetical protein [Nocardia mexicana]RDI49334.1 hypothetical protein DFR68_107462 [Nocardia mexicana]
MTTVRILLALCGVTALWYSVTLLLPMSNADLKSVAMWFAGGILLHDFVFAPLCAAAGYTGRRLLPRAAWAPVAYGAVCTVTLLVVAVPVLGRENAVAGNPSILDRPYAWGLIVASATVWTVVAVVMLRNRRRGRDLHCAAPSPRR